MKLDNYVNPINTLTKALRCIGKRANNIKHNVNTIEKSCTRINNIIGSMIKDFEINKKTSLECPHCNKVTIDDKLLDTETKIGEIEHLVAGYREITCSYCNKIYYASTRLYPMYNIKVNKPETFYGDTYNKE